MPRRSEQNLLQGDFGEAWLEAVAAGCEILHGRPATLDLQKADVQLTIRGLHGGTYNPTVKVQVKTSIHCRRNGDGDLVYDLDVKTFNVLRRVDHSVRRVLIVISVEPDGDLMRLLDDGTLLVGRGGWVSLEGSPPTSNDATTAVTVPAVNTLDGPGLTALVTTFGTRSSTPVPEVEEWVGEDE